MKLRIGLLLGGIALAVLALGALGALAPASSASAGDPELGEADAAYFYGEDAQMPRWLRHSIIVCAARTMDVEVERVKLGLRNGLSLEEIGIAAGIRPVQLENGILRCERALLIRLVEAEKLEPEQARRIFHFLEEHITRIVKYKWEGE